MLYITNSNKLLILKTSKMKKVFFLLSFLILLFASPVQAFPDTEDLKMEIVDCEIDFESVFVITINGLHSVNSYVNTETNETDVKTSKVFLATRKNVVTAQSEFNYFKSKEKVPWSGIKDKPIACHTTVISNSSGGLSERKM